MRRIAVRGVAAHESKILAVRLKQAPGFWCIPGGGLDDNESLSAGLEREMVEETGVRPELGPLLYVQQYAEPDDSREYLEFFFRIDNPKDYLDIDLSATSHGLEEIEEIDFVDPTKVRLLPEFFAGEMDDLTRGLSPTTKIFNYL